MKRESGKRGRLRLLNPRNLQKEVHIYGYHFSLKNQMLISVCALAAMAGIGILFKVNWFLMCLVCIAMALFLPGLILDNYKRMYEQKRFADVVGYIEQLMYSFQQSQKIKLALLECAEKFQEGRMKTAIENAVSYINRGKAESENILKEALDMIEGPYQCRRLRQAHELLVHAEMEGGDVENSVSLILEDNENWKRRVYKLQAEKKQIHTDNIISIAVAALLCALCLYVIDYMRVLFHTESAINVFENPFVQASSVSFLFFSMYTFAKSLKSMNNDWLGEEGLYEDERIQKVYQDVKGYEGKKEGKRSLVLAAPFLIAAVPVYLFCKKWAGIALLAVGAFLLLQDKIGQKLANRELSDAMRVALPQWLMEMALLLQNNNVQVSIMKSAERAPAVLKPELDSLMERLGADPDRLDAYTRFCEGFDMPEAQSCMKMLYSISEFGVGNAKVQINNLLGQINRMQDQADELINENTLFKMRMIFSYPVFLAAVKMLVDMTIGMFVMFQLMGSIGGL